MIRKDGNRSSERSCSTERSRVRCRFNSNHRALVAQLRENVVSNTRPTVAEKRQAFRKLHETGCFVIPNPWNVGTARYLQGLGFKALATTSSGHAHALGFPDGGQDLEMVLAHFKELAEATDIPLNADFEDGLADSPESVAAHVTRCIATGVAGLSIEDSP